ncbi:MAG TPA: hypothetical protein QGG51_01945 [Candidatus Pelagibacter bacterium]|jgi:hypothetical protein|nr:hypothetical protein [Candidatus Pelagibacter bacterium]|tara:strand:- start:533 stop:1186 length:654 start_codon:yes stop_codon:yes gene_type:complete
MRTNLRVIALICFILPILTVIISYIASVKLNLVPACIPNFEGCTSISRAGRNVPVKYFFKPMMYLYSFILFLYWYKFLEILNKFKISEKKFSFFSFFSVLFLILYIIFLGEGKIYEFFRRIGIYIYIFFTVITQFLISKKLFFIQKKIKRFFKIKFIKLNFFLTLFLVASGIIILPILIIKIDNFPEIKNIISWNYFILIQLYFIFSLFSFKIRYFK